MNVLGAAAHAAVGAFAGFAFGQLITGSEELNAAAMQYQASVGASAEETKAATADAVAFFRTNTEGYSEILGVMSTLRTAFGLSQGDAQANTQAFLDFAKATGQNSATAVETLSRDLKAWGLDVSQSTTLMDTLVRSHQLWNLNIGQAQSLLTTLAPRLQAVGGTLNDAIGLLDIFSARGLNAATAMRGLATAIPKLQAEGMSLDEYVAKLATIPDQASRTTAAMEVFGRIAGPALSAAIQPGMKSLSDIVTQMGGVAGSSEKAAEAIDSSFGAQATVLIHNITGALAGFGQQFGPLITAASTFTVVFGPRLFTLLTTAIGGVIGYLTSLASKTSETVAAGEAQAAANARVASSAIAMGGAELDAFASTQRLTAALVELSDAALTATGDLSLVGGAALEASGAVAAGAVGIAAAAPAFEASGAQAGAAAAQGVSQGFIDNVLSGAEGTIAGNIMASRVENIVDPSKVTALGTIARTAGAKIGLIEAEAIAGGIASSKAPQDAVVAALARMEAQLAATTTASTSLAVAQGATADALVATKAASEGATVAEGQRALALAFSTTAEADAAEGAFADMLAQRSVTGAVIEQQVAMFGATVQLEMFGAAEVETAAEAGVLTVSTGILSGVVDILTVSLTGAAVAAGVALAALLPILGPILVITAAIGILAVAWINNWGGIQEVASSAVNAIVGLFQQLGDILSGLVGLAQDAAGAITGFVKSIYGLVPAKDVIVDVARGGFDILRQALENVAGPAARARDALQWIEDRAKQSPAGFGGLTDGTADRALVQFRDDAEEAATAMDSYWAAVSAEVDKLTTAQNTAATSALAKSIVDQQAAGAALDMADRAKARLDQDLDSIGPRIGQVVANITKITPDWSQVTAGFTDQMTAFGITVQNAGNDLGAKLADGIKAAHDNVTAAWNDLLTALSTPDTRSSKIAYDGGLLLSEQLREGLASDDPLRKAEADRLVSSIITELQSLGVTAGQVGHDTGENYMQSLAASWAEGAKGVVGALSPIASAVDASLSRPFAAAQVNVAGSAKEILAETTAMATGMASALRKGGTDIGSAFQQILTDEKTTMSKAAEIGLAGGILTSTAVRTGMASQNPQTVADTMVLVTAIANELQALGITAYTLGDMTIKNFDAGFKGAAPQIQEDVRRSLGDALRPLTVGSPDWVKAIMFQIQGAGIDVTDITKGFTDAEKAFLGIADTVKSGSSQIKSDLTSAFSQAKSSADAYFDAVHAGIDRQISDIQKAADAQAKADYDKQLAALQGPITAAQAQMKAQQAAAQQLHLQESLAAAQATLTNLGPGADPTAAMRGVRDAQFALDQFLEQQGIDAATVAMNQQKATLDAQLAARLAHDKAIADLATANENARAAQTKKDFDAQFTALQKHLLSGKVNHKAAVDEITALYKKFGIDMGGLGGDAGKALVDSLSAQELIAAADAINSGQTIGQNLADGLASKQAAVEAAVKGLAGTIAKYVKVQSPTELGPLSVDASVWGAALANNFLGGINGVLDTAKVDTGSVANSLTSSATPSHLGTTSVTIDNRIFLDGQEMKAWVSKVLAEEVRSFAGPAVPGGPY